MPIEVDTLRHNPLVDPGLHVFGWQIPIDLFCGALAAGVMIFAVLLARRIPREKQSRAQRLLPFFAAAIVTVVMVVLFLDLENKLHLYRFYMALRLTSPMSWGAWILALVYPSTIAYGLARLNDDDVKRLRSSGPVPRAGKAVADLALAIRPHAPVLERINLVLGIALGVYGGVLLGTLPSHPAWASIVLGPLFLASGLVCAGAFCKLLPICGVERNAVCRWMVRAAVLQLALLACYFVEIVVIGGDRGRSAAALFFGGPFTAVFWTLVVVGGLLAPLVMEASELRTRAKAAVVAPALLLVGGLALRWIVIMAGQFPVGR